MKITTTRRSGRTTCGLLKTIISAIESPGEKVYYVDHALNDYSAQQCHSKTLKKMIESLGLKEIKVDFNNDGLYVESAYSGIIETEEGRYFSELYL